MPLWNNDEELFVIAREELFPALVGDALDKLGRLNQFLSPSIKPLQKNMKVIGRAMPVLEADVPGDVIPGTNNGLMRRPFGMMFDALDSLQWNEVYICSGSSHRYALWGGLMSIRALYLGAAGAVVNGFSRDTPEIAKLNFPTFGAGSYAQDQGMRGKVLDYRIPIEFSGVIIKPGDIVFGDLDGVLIIPRELEEDVFSAAIEKARSEKVVRKALEEGMSSKDAFERFGIM